MSKPVLELWRHGLSWGALFIAFYCALSFGPSNLRLSDLWSTHEHAADLRLVFFNIRLPRVLVAALAGAGLGVAGVLSQGLFRNSLASPSILGTGAASSFAAVLVYYNSGPALHWLSLPIAASLGAFGATFFLVALIRSTNLVSTENILLIGFAISALLGSMTSLVVSFALEHHEKAAAMMQWLLGGFQGTGINHLLVLCVIVPVGIFFAFSLAQQLDVYALGEEVAATLAVDPRRLMYGAMACLSLLVGGIVSFVGLIPFVGLVVPHVARLLHGSKHRRLIYFSGLHGAVLVVLADLIARTIIAPAELEVGVLTSLMGAPLFIYLLARRRSFGR